MNALELPLNECKSELGSGMNAQELKGCKCVQHLVLELVGGIYTPHTQTRPLGQKIRENQDNRNFRQVMGETSAPQRLRCNGYVRAVNANVLPVGNFSAELPPTNVRNFRSKEVPRSRAK